MLAQRVIDVIATTMNIPRKDISVDSSFAELGIDSLQGLNLLFAVETEFDINIQNPSALSLRSVRDLVEALEKLLAENVADPAR
jgi:acyl carrier protein